MLLTHGIMEIGIPRVVINLLNSSILLKNHVKPQCSTYSVSTSPSLPLSLGSSLSSTPRLVASSLTLSRSCRATISHIPASIHHAHTGVDEVIQGTSLQHQQLDGDITLVDHPMLG
jgi:hypothetical protein